jgi:predicted RNase H-like HicB family nuclease
MRYTYIATWSKVDEEWIATCVEFPSLSYLHVDSTKALDGLKNLVQKTITEMREAGEAIPKPRS